MTEYKHGQRVHVEYDGVITYVYSTGKKVMITDSAGRRSSASMQFPTPADPENWPPQIGDIWEADGSEYFCRQGIVNPDRLVLVSADSRPSVEPEPFKALNPVLVRRRGE